MTSLIDQGLAHHDAGDLDRAEQCYLDAVAENGADTEALKLLALVMMEKGNADEAVTYIEAAVDLQPDVAQYRHLLGRIRAAQGRMPEAAEALRLASDHAGPERFLILGDLGLCLEQLQSWEEAERVYAEILMYEPNNRTALHGKAGSAVALGDLDTARDTYQLLLQLDPADSAASSGMAQVLGWIADKTLP
jgi:protein O-GlcNAc transferase